MARQRIPDNAIIELITPILEAAGYRHHAAHKCPTFRRRHLTWWHRETADGLILEIALLKTRYGDRLSLVYSVCLEPADSVKDHIADLVNEAHEASGCKREPLVRDKIDLVDAVGGSSKTLLDRDTQKLLSKFMLVDATALGAEDQALLKHVVAHHLLPALDRLASRKALAEYYRSDDNSLGLPFWPLAAALGIPKRRFPEAFFDLLVLGAPGHI